jgi:hypothetical protein
MPKNWTLNFASIAYSDVAEARNFLLTHWFDKSDATHLLFVDADMGFEPELVLDMLSLKKPLVGAIYTRRQVDLARLAKLAAGGEPAQRAIARAHDFIVRPVRGRAPRRQNGFIEVEGCGAGLLLIQRACVETMLKQMPEISDAGGPKNTPLARNLTRLIRAFDPLTVDGGRLSEDFSFCHRWRKGGGEIWARADKAVTHIGLHRFEGRYSDARTGTRITLKPENLKFRRGVPSGQTAAGVKLREGGKTPREIRGKLQVPKGGEKGKPVKH